MTWSSNVDTSSSVLAALDTEAPIPTNWTQIILHCTVSKQNCSLYSSSKVIGIHVQLQEHQTDKQGDVPLRKLKQTVHILYWIYIYRVLLVANAQVKEKKWCGMMDISILPNVVYTLALNNSVCSFCGGGGGGTKFKELLKHLGMPAEPLLKRSAVHHIPISTIKYLSAEILEPLCGAVWQHLQFELNVMNSSNILLAISVLSLRDRQFRV